MHPLEPFLLRLRAAAGTPAGVSARSVAVDYVFSFTVLLDWDVPSASVVLFGPLAVWVLCGAGAAATAVLVCGMTASLPVFFFSDASIHF